MIAEDEFYTEYIEEPDLMFSGGVSKDPRVGLVKHGPRTPSNESEHLVVKVGLIGSSYSIGALERLFDDMRHQITVDKEEPERWNPPFPGLGEDSAFNFSLNFQKRWRQTITSREISAIKNVRDKDERIEKALEYITNHIGILYSKETPPDIIFVAIPEEIKKACTPSGQKRPKLQTGQSDFRSRIKLAGMKNKIPTQLIRPSTLRGEGTQDKANMAWNLAVAILYKARKGHPWKLTKLEQGTCYAGISFYRERGQDSNRTCPTSAQVFLETGESFILRGDPVEEEQKGRGNNHLSHDDAERVVNQILEQYERIKGMQPERLVLHKTSEYWDEEREGFLDGADGIRKLDFVTIRQDHPLRLFSSGDYPVLRGTLATPPNEQEHYLFTKGFIPSLSTYPEQRIPKPVVVKPDNEINDSSYQEICREILSFTKLDWNNSHFCGKMPVTIDVSRAVGRILAESISQDMSVDPHYYFYM